MIARILIPVAVMAGLGILFGFGLAYALKLFGITSDEIIEKILSKLPGSNCGACGKAGCAGFAIALQKGQAQPSGCVLSKEDTRKSIAEILGIDFDKTAEKKAIVLCNGGNNAKDKYKYTGIKTCKAATLLFGGYKACTYGCIGFGDCKASCPFGAIEMDDNLPRIDLRKCTGCGNCVKVCPKNITALNTADNKYYVKCSSNDTGPYVRKVCFQGCIGCGICAKLSNGAFVVSNNLARPDNEKIKNITNGDEIMIKCPTKVIKQIL